MREPERSAGEIPALEALGRELDQAVASLEAPRRASISRFVIPGVLVLVVAFMSLTGPGRALAEQVGKLVGIGEPSSVREADLRDPRLTETQERIGPAIVVAEGSIPGGERFEIVAWAAREKPGLNHPVPIDPRTGRPTVGHQASGEIMSCVGVVYPDVGEQQTGKWCSDEPPDGAIDVFGMGRAAPGESARELGRERPYQVIGVAAPQAARVSVTYEDEAGSRVEAPVTFGIADEAVLEKTGGTEPLGFFVATIPRDDASRAKPRVIDSPYLRTVSVTAFDEHDEVLGRQEAGARIRQ